MINKGSVKTSEGVVELWPCSEYGLEKLVWYIDRYDARRGSVLLANVISPRNINVL